jgi:hypothetical protein
MLNSKVRAFAVAIAIVGAFSVMATPAQAKSVKCFGNPVPGQPGVFIVHCGTARP